MNQLRFKHTCLECKLFDSCDNAEVEDDIQDSSVIEERVDGILKKLPEFNLVIEVMKKTLPEEVLSNIYTIPDKENQNTLHMLGFCDLEQILCLTELYDGIIHGVQSKQEPADILIRLNDIFTPELVSATLMSELLRLYAKNPDLLMTKISEITNPFSNLNT